MKTLIFVSVGGEVPLLGTLWPRDSEVLRRFNDNSDLLIAGYCSLHATKASILQMIVQLSED
jgi:hypothetical protein